MDSKKLFVKDVTVSLQFEGTFLVSDKVQATGKNGKSYLSLKLNDLTGSLDARVWDQADVIGAKFADGDIIWVKAAAQEFQDRLQIVVQKAEMVDPSLIKIEDYIKPSKFQPHELLEKINILVAQIKSEYVKKIFELTFADKKTTDLFLRLPAAKSIHHAWIGGLAEHSLSVAELLLKCADHYKSQNIELDQDLLIFGAFFHDFGKIWELELLSTGLTNYTDEGRMVGHLIMGVEWIDKLASQIPGFPNDLKLKLKHIIVSHHGKVEFGSPKTPVTLEALLVSQIDELDSRLSSIFHLIESEKNNSRNKGDWSKYSQLYERYFYLK